MQVTISHAGLLKVVKACIKAANKKATMPILGHILLETDGETINASATDLEIAIQCRTPAHIESPGSVALPAKKLLDYLRLLPDSDMTLKVDSAFYATISCGRSRTRIAGMSKDQFPEIPSMSAPAGSLPAGLLASVAEKVISSVAQEESRFTLNGALGILANGSLSMVGTDGHRLALVSQRTDSSISHPLKMLIPRKALDDLIRLCSEMEPDSEVAIADDGNTVFFSFGDCVLACRKLSGSFPEYERILPKQHKIRVEAATAELRPAIERARQFANETTHAVKLTIANGSLTLSSSTDDTWESEESIPVDSQDASLNVAFNANYLLDALRVIPTEKAALLFNDPSSAAEIVPVGDGLGGEFRYVVMPMRI